MESSQNRSFINDDPTKSKSFINNNTSPKSTLSRELKKLQAQLEKNDLSISFFKQLDRISEEHIHTLSNDLFLAGRLHKLYSDARQQLAKCRIERSRQLFIAIPKNEFSKITSKNPEERQAYNENTADFNSCSLYIKLDILLSSTFTESMLAIERWCYVLNVAKESHDYNSIFIILSALNSTAITMLIGNDIHENTHLTPEAKRILAEVIDLTDYQFNFKKVRAAMSENTRVIPYIGIYSHDLTFIRENDEINNNESAKDILAFLHKTQEENKALKNVYFPVPWEKESVLAAFEKLQIPDELCVGVFYSNKRKNEILELEKLKRTEAEKLKSGEMSLFSNSEYECGVINDLFCAVAYTLTKKNKKTERALSEINGLLADERTFFEAPTILRKTAKDSLSSSSPSPSSASSQTEPFFNLGKGLSKSTEDKIPTSVLNQKATRGKSNSMKAQPHPDPSDKTDANENNLRPGIKRTSAYPDLANYSSFRLFRILSFETKKYEQKLNNNNNETTGAVNTQKDRAHPPKLMYKQSYQNLNIKNLDPSQTVDPGNQCNVYKPLGRQFPSLERERTKQRLLETPQSKSPLKTANENPPKAPKPFKTILRDIKAAFLSPAPYVNLNKFFPEPKDDEANIQTKRPHSI